MINPLSPEIKQQIDIIKNNPNTSPEKKQEQFGLLMGGLRSQFGGPPLKPMNRPSDVNMQPDVNINDINNAKYTGSQRMNFKSAMEGIPIGEHLKQNPNGAVNQYLREREAGAFVPSQGNHYPINRLVPPAGVDNIPTEKVGGPQTNTGPIPFSGPLHDEQNRPLNPNTGAPMPPMSQNGEDGISMLGQGAQMPQGRAFNSFTPTPIPQQGQPQQQQQGLNNNIFGMPQGGNNGRFGMTGYFDRLFNNPARMAMLSGGLTAMDQNSYYDKEGFSSPWSGLRAGLGGAQAGYKSVIDRRKAEAETEKLKAEAGMVGSAQDPTDYRSFLKSQKDGYTGTYQKWLDRKWGRQSGIESPIIGALKKGYENTMKQLPDMQLAAEQDILGLRNLYESKKFLDQGIISGTFANPIAGFHIMLKTRFGIDTGSDAENTVAFAASMGNQVGQIIKQFGAGTGLSDADREYAEKIVGGDPGSLTEASIRELMRIQEKMYRHKIKNYQRKSSPFIKALKEAGGQGLDYSISTEGLDLESTTDWGKKVGKYYDPRRAAMGNYYYKRDADGKITDKKRYRTPQNNPSGVGKAVLTPLNEKDRDRLKYLEEKFGND